MRGSYLTTATDGPGPSSAVSYEDGATTGAGAPGLWAGAASASGVGVTRFDGVGGGLWSGPGAPAAGSGGRGVPSSGSAGIAPSAFITTDHRSGKVGRQISLTPFTLRLHLQHIASLNTARVISRDVLAFGLGDLHRRGEQLRLALGAEPALVGLPAVRGAIAHAVPPAVGGLVGDNLSHGWTVAPERDEMWANPEAEAVG